MKTFYFFIHSDSCAERATIFNVPFGISQREQTQLQKITICCASNSDFYFAKRDNESSEFVRKLMDNCQCTLSNATPAMLIELIKSVCPSANAKNLSENYEPFRIIRA